MRTTIIFFFILLAAACKKSQDPQPIVSELKVHCTVLHHTYTIPNATVFMKEGTIVWPGDSPALYDRSIQTDANGQVTFSGLGGGKYVFWAVGYDATVADSVSGYMVINSFLEPGEKKELELTIPVSE